MADQSQLSLLERMMEETKPADAPPKDTPKVEEAKPAEDKPVEEKAGPDDKKPEESKPAEAKGEPTKEADTKKPDARKDSTGSKKGEGRKLSDAKKAAEPPQPSKPPASEDDDQSNLERRDSNTLATNKSNKALASKASKAIAEMKANFLKEGRSLMKKEKKGKLLSITQQLDAHMTARDDHVFKAKMAQSIERWDEMVHWIRRVAVIKARVTVDERNLISCAYGNACKSRREAWNKLTAIELKERAKPESKARNKRILRTMYYRHSIEEQIKKLCNEILGILDKHLITHAKTAESKVFFFKMQGDFNRYLAEISFRPKQRRKYTMLSMGSYKAAAKIGNQELPVTHPIRLANGLNYAVLWYDLMDNPERACRITKNTFDLSIMELDIMKGVSEELVDCAQDLMHSLRDNITLWARVFDPDWHHGVHHTQSRFVSRAPVKGTKSGQPETMLQSSAQSTPQANPFEPMKKRDSVKQLFKAGAKPRGNSH